MWLNKEELEAEEYEEDELNELYNEIEWEPGDKLDKVSNIPLSLIEATPSTSAINETSLSKIPTMTEKDKNLIVVEPDEVMVRSQEEDSEWLIHYNAVVVKEGITHYLTAPTSAHLFYQVGGLLARLGLNKAENRLLVIGDGAVWIRRWVDSIGIEAERKTSVLGWLHLKKYCSRLVREGLKNRADRAVMRKKLFQYLWRGKVGEARGYISRLLTDIEDNETDIAINNIKALAALKEYLLMRQAHISDYLMRLRNKEWIANTKIEKFNDFAISQRCKKKNGMKWTRLGVGAIAALETARRNEELRYWRQQGKLPRWQEQTAA